MNCVSIIAEAESLGKSLSAALKQKAFSLGFDSCRIVAAEPVPHAEFVRGWLNQGRAGEMHYLERNVEKRLDPRLLVEEGMPAFRSLIVLAVDYYQGELSPEVRADPSRGLIASYAWGEDYHEVIRPLLYELDRWLREQTGRTTPAKCLVDSGPVLERDWAARAGIGFTGKNCCTIHPRAGSWLFLATIAVPECLEVDPSPVGDSLEPEAEQVLNGLLADGDYGRWTIPLWQNAEKDAIGTCGHCTRCLDACPTSAFVGPYHLDPLRCISYWTIETDIPVPVELRPLFGNRIFGCDICQEVCPWNKRLGERRPRIEGLHAVAQRMAPPLLEGFDPNNPYWLDDDAFRRHFRRSPIRRARRHGMLRNVCIALGNWADPTAVAALALALHDREALARGHAAWALGCILRRHALDDARILLTAALAHETDLWVRSEIESALDLESS